MLIKPYILNTFIKFSFLLLCSLSSLQLQANNPIDSLRTELIEQSKKNFKANSELFILTHSLLNKLSIDSINLILSSFPSNKYKSFTLSYLSHYQLDYDPTISKIWLHDALDIAKQSQDPKLLYWVHRHYGFYHKTINEKEEALRHFNLSNEFAERSNFDRGKTINLLHFAELYQSFGDYTKAFEYGFANLEARQPYPQDFGLAYAHAYLGDLYTFIESYSEAMNQYTAAENIFREEKELNYTGVMINSKAKVFQQQNMLDSALVSFQKSIRFFEQTGSKYFRGTTHNHIGSNYFSRQDYTLALEHYLIADTLLSNGPYHISYVSNIKNIGLLYLEQGQYDLAEKYFQRAIEKLVNVSGFEKYYSSFYNDLSKLYLTKASYSKAKEYAGLSAIQKDQIEQDKNQLIAFKYLLEAHLQLGESDEAIAVQKDISALSVKAKQVIQERNKSNLKLSYEIKRQRDLFKKEKQWNARFLWSVVIGLIIISLLFLNIAAITKKRNKTLAEKNMEIAKLNEELEQKVKTNIKDLREKTQQLNNYFDNLPGVSYRLKCNADFSPVFISRGSYDLFGIKPERILHSQTYRNLIHPDYYDKRMQLSHNFIKQNDTNEILELVYPIKVEDKLKWVVDRSKLLIDSDGEKYLQGILLDITDQMIAEAALKISQEELSLIYNHTQDFMGLIRRTKLGDFVFESFNQPYLDHLTSAGLFDDEQDIEGMKVCVFMRQVLNLSEFEIKERLSYIKTAHLSQQRINYETTIANDRHGNKNIYDVMLTPIIENDKKTSDRIIFVMHDITQRVNAETALTRSEKRLSTIYNNTQDFMGLMQVSPSGEIIIESFNEPYIAFLHQIGTLEKDQQLSGMHLPDYFKNIIGMPDEGISKRVDAIRTACQLKEVVTFDTLFPIASHKEKLYTITLTPIVELGSSVYTRIIFVMHDITKRRNAEKALIQSEKRLSTIYNSSHDFIGLININAKGNYEMESFNQPAVDFLINTGVISDPDTVLGIEMESLFRELYGLPDEPVRHRMKNIQAVFTQNKTFKYESLFAPPDKGVNVYFETIISPILNAEGVCTYALYTARDITESKISKDKIIASEKRLSMVFNGTEDQMLLFNVRSNGELIFEDANRAFKNDWKLMLPKQNIKEIYNTNASLFLSKRMGYSKEQIEERLKLIHSIIEGKNPHTYEEALHHSDHDEPFLLEITVTPILNQNNVCEKVLFTVKDITEKVASQRALARSEKQLSTIYNSSNDFIGLIQLQDDDTFIIRSINQPGIDFLINTALIDDPKKLIGIEMKLLYQKVFGLVPAAIDNRMKMIQKVFFDHQTIKHHNPLAPVGKDIYMSFETTISPIVGQGGKCTQALYVAKDITESEIAKNKILASQKRLASIFNGSNDMMGIVDVRNENELLFENTNDAFKKVWAKVNPNINLEDSYSKSLEFLLLSVMRHPKADVEARLQICHQVIKDKKSCNYEEVFLPHNNKKYILDVTISPILDEEDVCKKLLFVIRDVTLKHKAKEKMISKILETEDRERSRFAKELHDSLGQNLTAASLNFNFVKKSIDALNTDTQKKFTLGFNFLKEAIDESRNIAHNLMPQAISDFGFILSIESLLENLAQTTDIEFTFYDNLNRERLPVDHELSLYRITQEAINNILKHAEATNVSIQLIKHSTSVILTIEDNGKGFSTQSQSFNSFGLNSMKNRASALSGVLDIDSRPNKGTAITLEIPV